MADTGTGPSGRCQCRKRTGLHHGVQRLRSVQQEALGVVHAIFPKALENGLRFDILRHRLDPDDLGNVDEAANGGRIQAIEYHIADELAINLQLVYIEALQVTKDATPAKRSTEARC